MRLLCFLTGFRPAARHLVLGVESALALTACLLLARAVVLF